MVKLKRQSETTQFLAALNDVLNSMKSKNDDHTSRIMNRIFDEVYEKVQAKLESESQSDA